MQQDLSRFTTEQLQAEVSRRTATKKRPYYATKAEWADAQACELQARLDELDADYVPGTTAARTKVRRRAQLQGEINRFKAMAASFRAEGK